MGVHSDQLVYHHSGAHAALAVVTLAVVPLGETFIMKEWYLVAGGAAGQVVVLSASSGAVLGEFFLTTTDANARARADNRFVVAKEGQVLTFLCVAATTSLEVMISGARLDGVAS